MCVFLGAIWKSIFCNGNEKPQQKWDTKKNKDKEFMDLRSNSQPTDVTTSGRWNLPNFHNAKNSQILI